MKTQDDSLEAMRHSASHLLAAAVQKLFPDTKFAIGPAIDDGFYYDFEFSTPLVEDDLKKIEKEMISIKNKKYVISGKQVSFKEAMDIFKNQPYKLELITDLEKEGGKEMGIYTLGDFVDLCKGPHLDNTEKIGAFKLMSLAGAYWRGDEKNKMLTRIYGVAFPTKEDINKHLEMLEEMKKRDHKKLGKDLDLFSFHSESPGCPFWHEKGMVLWNIMEKFGKSLRKKYGYIEIKTPLIAKNSLWITSGHWDHYKDGMFMIPVGEETYCLKPMDCPFNIKIYQTKTRSYKDLPIRYTEIGRVHRNEKSGELNGLFRVQEITQDDSHLFLREDQVHQEIVSLLRMVKEYYAALTIEPQFFLSTRPDDFMGEIPTWDKAEEDLRKALESEGIEYGMKEKDGAFYGPKIDVNLKDVFGRSWQVATIQLDFQLPGRFNCEYTADDGSKKTPVMIHAAVFGSFERMIGILIEHFGGEFPLWLAPVQIKILPVNDKLSDYVNEIVAKLRDPSFTKVSEGREYRIEVDNREESLGKKIRNAELEKVPYMIVIGDKEAEEKVVSIRSKKDGDLGQMKIEEFIEKIK